MSDGCTGWFDGTWVACCNLHDEAGVSLESNLELARCVAEHSPAMAAIMLIGTSTLGIGYAILRGRRKRKKWPETEDN